MWHLDGSGALAPPRQECGLSPCTAHPSSTRRHCPALAEPGWASAFLASTPAACMALCRNRAEAFQPQGHGWEGAQLAPGRQCGPEAGIPHSTCCLCPASCSGRSTQGRTQPPLRWLSPLKWVTKVDLSGASGQRMRVWPGREPQVASVRPMSTMRRLQGDRKILAAGQDFELGIK